MDKLLKLFSVSAFGCFLGMLFLSMPYVVIILPALLLVSLNAVFAVTAWLISEIYLGNYQVLGANPRTFIVLLAGAMFFCREIIVYKGENLKGTLDLLRIPLLLVALGIAINVFSGVKFSGYSRWLITLVSNLMMVLLMGFGIRNSAQFRQVIFIFLTIVLIDCAIGILQFLGVQEAYLVREYTSKSQIHSPVGRILGLSRNIIEYSYLLLLGFFLFAGNALTKEPRLKQFMQVGLIVLAVTLIINATRSAIGGIFIALIIYFLFHRKIFREETVGRYKIAFGLGAMVLLVLTAWFMFQFNNNSNIFSKKWLSLQDTSAVGRLYRFQLAFDMSLRNPFGIGTANVDKYLYDYWAKLPAGRGISLKEFSAHNNFLRTMLEYGFLGGILLVVFLITLFRKAILLFRRTNDPYMKNMLLAVFYFLFAYIFHIFFHNFGPVYGDNVFWFLVGLLVCASNIILQEGRQVNLNA